MNQTLMKVGGWIIAIIIYAAIGIALLSMENKGAAVTIGILWLSLTSSSSRSRNYSTASMLRTASWTNWTAHLTPCGAGHNQPHPTPTRFGGFFVA